MLDLSQLPPWSDVFSRLGERPPRRNRGRCPIHGGDSPQSVALDENRGLYYCHVCHSGGGKIDFIKNALHTDFRGAMRWFGLEPGKPPVIDADTRRRNAAMDRVREWVRTTGRRLRDQFLSRQRITRYAQERLASDPEDDLAWELLRIAFDAQTRTEFLLDEIDLCRDDDERLHAWRTYRNEL